MTKEEILEKLRDDQHYYGEFGKQFLSNSNISSLLTNPLEMNVPQAPNPNFAIGGYFHTAILEPDKLHKYKIINTTTRNTNVYKELSGGEICLLQHEVDNIELLKDKMLANKVCEGLIRGFNVEYEVPGIADINNVMWKGKADIINHDEGLIVDLKTTSDLSGFAYSAKKYNYDSQAKVMKAVEAYNLFFKTEDFDPQQHLLTKTL